MQIFECGKMSKIKTAGRVAYQAWMKVKERQEILEDTLDL
jgi:hypothetical protein